MMRVRASLLSAFKVAKVHMMRAPVLCSWTPSCRREASPKVTLQRTLGDNRLPSLEKALGLAATAPVYKEQQRREREQQPTVEAGETEDGGEDGRQ